MPRRATLKDDEREPLVDETASNGGINATLLNAHTAEYEEAAAEIERIMTEARAKCQPFVDRQKEIAKEASEAGIEKKAFKAKLRERSLLRRAEKVTSDLSERQTEIFLEITQKMQLPLFSDLEDKAREAA